MAENETKVWQLRANSEDRDALAEFARKFPCGADAAAEIVKLVQRAEVNAAHPSYAAAFDAFDAATGKMRSVLEGVVAAAETDSERTAAEIAKVRERAEADDAGRKELARQAQAAAEERDAAADQLKQALERIEELKTIAARVEAAEAEAKEASDGEKAAMKAQAAAVAEARESAERAAEAEAKLAEERAEADNAAKLAAKDIDHLKGQLTAEAEARKNASAEAKSAEADLAKAKEANARLAAELEAARADDAAAKAEAAKLTEAQARNAELETELAKARVTVEAAEKAAQTARAEADRYFRMLESMAAPRGKSDEKAEDTAKAPAKKPAAKRSAAKKS